MGFGNQAPEAPASTSGGSLPLQPSGLPAGEEPGFHNINQLTNIPNQGVRPLQPIGRLGKGEFGQIDVRTDFIRQLEAAFGPLIFEFLQNPGAFNQNFLSQAGIGEVPGLVAPQGQSQLNSFLFGGAPVEQKQFGGPLDPNAFSIVGEGGPEIIPPGNAEVIPLQTLLGHAPPGVSTTAGPPPITQQAPPSAGGIAAPIPGTEPQGLPGQGAQFPGGFVPQINVGGQPLAPQPTGEAPVGNPSADFLAAQAANAQQQQSFAPDPTQSLIPPESAVFQQNAQALQQFFPGQNLANLQNANAIALLQSGQNITPQQLQQALANTDFSDPIGFAQIILGQQQQAPAPQHPPQISNFGGQPPTANSTQNSPGITPVDLPPPITVPEIPTTEGFQPGPGNPSSGPGAIQNFLEQQAPEQQTFQQAQDLLFGPNGILGGPNSGQAIIDALQPLFERNLGSSLAQLTNSAPSVFGSGFGQAGSGLAQQALQDFNLFSAQALQQGQQNTLGGLGVLGQLAGQAGQNPFQRLLGAGQLDLNQQQLGQQQSQFESQFGLAQNQQQFNQTMGPLLAWLQSIFGFAGGPTAFQTVQGAQ